MLIQKKIDSKKLAFYIIIIIFMISGAIFFIQKNKALTDRRSVPVIMEFSDEVENKKENIELTDKNIKLEEDQNLDDNEKIEILNLSKVLDLDVLLNQKFKKLKESINKPFDFVTGNEDLFISIN